MRKLLLLLSSLLFTVSLPCRSQSGSATGALPPWPDSSRNSRAIVNANQYIETYIRAHPDWFTDDMLVTDLFVINVPSAQRAQAAATYARVRAILVSRGMLVGTYTSGTTVRVASNRTQWPYEGVSYDDMPRTARYAGFWPDDPSRQFVDVTDVATRRALQAAIRRIWEGSPARLRFVDNAAVHPGMGRMQPWKAYCDNMREIREMAESMGSRPLFNVALSVEALSDEEADELTQAVGQGGIALETPWPTSVREEPKQTERARRRYRQLLDSGMAIVMIPVKTPADALAAWVRTWRRPSDPLYLAGPFWKEPDPKVYRPAR